MKIVKTSQIGKENSENFSILKAMWRTGAVKQGHVNFQKIQKWFSLVWVTGNILK